MNSLQDLQKSLKHLQDSRYNHAIPATVTVHEDARQSATADLLRASVSVLLDLTLAKTFKSGQRLLIL